MIKKKDKKRKMKKKERKLLIDPSQETLFEGASKQDQDRQSNKPNGADSFSEKNVFCVPFAFCD